MPHPFCWVPAGGQRHVSGDRRPEDGCPTGLEVETFCGQRLVAENSELAWLWATCAECFARAKKLAGASR